MLNYIVKPKAKNSITIFYRNVSKKYPYTYTFGQMNKNINDAYNSIYKIENGLQRREPTLIRWQIKGYNMAHDGKWYFAYTMDDANTITVWDACHSQNMHNPIKECKTISELAEFHSWMQRLDEVKGARPTFWCN